MDEPINESPTDAAQSNGAPVLIQPLLRQVVNEQAAFGPIDLNDYVESPNRSDKPRFSAVLASDAALPAGLICTADGQFTGIPAKGTAGVYDVIITAENNDGSLQIPLLFLIKPSLATKSSDYLEKVKNQVWEALINQQPVPELADLLDRPVTELDIYYLLERWGILKIWDAFNLDPPHEKKLLQLDGLNEHYNVYDCGCFLIGAPKNLFSHERTLQDGLQMAQIMAREVYHRGWVVELVGFEKFTRAAWVEIQQLGDKLGKRLEVINFNPSPGDVKLYNDIASMRRD